MSTFKRVRSTILTLAVFVLTCAEMALAKVWPIHEPGKVEGAKTLPPGAQQGVLLRGAVLRRSSQVARQYALEVTGGFPFVRVITLAPCAIHVPLESAALLERSAPEVFELQVAFPGGVARTAANGLNAVSMNAYMYTCTTGCASCGCGGCGTVPTS